MSVLMICKNSHSGGICCFKKTEVHILLVFPYCPISVLGSYMTFSHHVSWALLDWQFFWLSSFWWPWQFWVLVRYFVTWPPNVPMFCFSWLDWVVGFQEEEHRDPVLSSPHPIGVHTTNMTYHVDKLMLTLIILVEVVFVSLSTLKLTVLCPLHTVLFGRNSISAAHDTRNGELCFPFLRAEHLYKLLGLFLIGRFVYSLPSIYPELLF